MAKALDGRLDFWWAIDPHKTPIGFYRQNDLDPAVYRFYNSYGNRASDIWCQPMAAKFLDGSSWVLQQDFKP